MALGSAIEWTESTWNPVTGCTKVSPGCKHCYAERMAKRLQAMGQANYRDGFRLTLQPQMLELPLAWRRPQTIFVNSMSDLFHVDVPLEYVQRVFDVMRRAHWHRFQILTKRSARLAEIAQHLDWAPNVWMGVSVETATYFSRIDDLRTAPAAVRFLSLEPLLGPLPRMDLSRIGWVIAGGESGPRARPMDPELGRRHSRPVPLRPGALLLQAVGRGEQEESRARTRRPHVERDARRPRRDQRVRVAQRAAGIPT
jgi:protein gp37